MTILWSDIVGYRRISSDVFGLSSNRLSIGGSIQGVSAEILSFKISWQAQYLVRLEGDLIGSAHWKWRFICDADHRGHSFCVAGAVFGDVGGWLYLLHALEMTSHLTSQISDDIHFAWQAQYLVRLAGDFSWQAQHFVTFWEIAGTRNVVFYNTKSSPSWDESGLRSGGCEMTILWSDIVGCVRIIVESSFYWRKHSGSFRWNLELQDFVAGAVFGEVGGWLYLLRALEMTFHMWRRSVMTFILCGRRSTSWHFGR